MRTRFLVFGFLCFASLMMLGLYRLDSSSRADNADWEEVYPRALAKAKESGKMLLLDFTGSDWCVYCQRLEREVFSTERFKNYAKDKYVLMRVDFPRRTPQPDAMREQNEALQRTYDQQAFPTIVILNSQGKLVTQFPFEEGSADKFMSILEKVPRS